MTFKEHTQRPILKTFDLWDNNYNSDNWEQQSQQSQWPLNKEWQGQNSQFLRSLKVTQFSLLGYFPFFVNIKIQKVQM